MKYYRKEDDVYYHMVMTNTNTKTITKTKTKTKTTLQLHRDQLGL